MFQLLFLTWHQNSCLIPNMVRNPGIFLTNSLMQPSGPLLEPVFLEPVFLEPQEVQLKKHQILEHTFEPSLKTWWKILFLSWHSAPAVRLFELWFDYFRGPPEKTQPQKRPDFKQVDMRTITSSKKGKFCFWARPIFNQRAPCSWSLHKNAGKSSHGHFFGENNRCDRGCRSQR